MSSFLTHRERVHDARLPAYRRHSALRTCLTSFAPYGLRATYHHLTLSAGIPRRLEADPDALVRAVEELHEARVLWLARAREYAARRQAEKWAGRRQLTGHRPWWLWDGWDAPERPWYDAPLRHPPLRLPDYVRRRNALLDGVTLPGCPACGYEGPPEVWPTVHGGSELCGRCGRTAVACPCGHHHLLVDAGRSATWSVIWQRRHLRDDGLPRAAGEAAAGGGRPGGRGRT